MNEKINKISEKAKELYERLLQKRYIEKTSTGWKNVWM